MPGIAAPVEIVRDADNIPHIFAGSRADAFYGLGYVHAQDRLWQMEFQRRIGHGRLSEIFGAATLPQDRFLRTAGFGRAAVSAWRHLPESSRALVNAYVAGVNAFLEGARLPPEFTLLRFAPEPWTGPDVLVWVKMMAWDLSANYSLELLRHDIAAKVGQERLRMLMPPYPIDGPSIYVDRPDLVRAEALAAKAFGFGAKACIHPAQLEVVHEVFAASALEREWAERVLDRAASASGAFQLDGQMVDEPVIQRARRILGR